MNKNELIVAQAQLSAQRFAEGCKIVRHLASLGAGIWAISIVVAGIVQISQGHPDAITAVARVVQAFSLDRIALVFVSGGLGAAWYLERKGKKRAVKQLGEARKKEEAGDAYRSSSNLRDDGGTPRETEHDQ